METRNLQVPNKVLIGAVKELLREGRTATFRVKGVSMRLFLENERDLVKLEPARPESIAVGDVVLAEIAPDSYVLHRVIHRDGEQLTLMGDGNLVGTESCSATDVVGVATAFYRKGRKRPDLVSGRKWRVYSYLWLRLKPLRRLILGIYRRLPFHI